MILALDLETTGLDPDYCQIIEIAAIADIDPNVCINDLPTFHRLVDHGRFSGEATALAINHEIFFQLSIGVGQPVNNVQTAFDEFLKCYTGTYSVLGQNAAGFDLQFLRRWSHSYPFHHRVFDLGNLYYDREYDGDKLPGLSVCLDRAGFETTVTHRALDDARQTLRAFRALYGGNTV